MAIIIRLTRAGRRHLPFYHIGVFDVRTRRDGKPVEQIGFYDPTGKKEQVRLNTDRARYWLDQGAKPSETMASILKQQGIGSEFWLRKRKKPSKPKVRTADKKAQKDKARKVKHRKKPRTANSKTRAEKKAAK